ncbi:MAG: M23 family metallopeptidase [Candidatus Arcticimaribacter sp.]
MTQRIKHLLFISLFAILSPFLQAQNEATPPLDIPLKLSGTFGEFRPTHFHAGLDIKTQGKEGFKVSSIKAGSIRRIRVATSGYGKCLYIQHADGTTSVYAHLKKFAPKIESFIKAYQYEQETFVTQKFLKLGEMTVEQGEIIGYSGNTGGSLGPHLHFEIRDTKEETPLNPLQLGFEIPDSIRPIVQGLYRYKKDVNGLSAKIQIPLERVNDSVYQADILRLGGTHAFGIRLFDRQDLSYNRNGIYKATVNVNGSNMFSYTFDKIDFKDGKKIDALIDYPTYREERIRVQKLFRDLDVDYSFLPKTAPNGFIEFTEDRAYQVEIIVEDYANNKTYVSFYVEGKTDFPLVEKAPMQNPIHPDQDYLFAFDQHEVYIPKNTFYQTIDLSVEEKKDTLFIANTTLPQRKGFELNVAIPEALDSLQRQQLSLAIYDPEEEKEEKQLRYVWTAKKDSILQTKYAYPGQYVLTKDSLAPSIKPLNFKDQQWMSNYKFLEIEVDDEFSGIKSYRATMNGQWILMEHEPKDNTLIYDFSDIEFDQTQLNFELEVEDQVGNQSVFKAIIFRKKR